MVSSWWFLFEGLMSEAGVAFSVAALVAVWVLILKYHDKNASSPAGEHCRLGDENIGISSTSAEEHQLDDGRVLTGPFKEMGRGTFGAVCQYSLNGRPVAVKIPTGVEYNQMQERELHLLEQVSTHPNIITLHGSAEIRGMTFIIMDLMAGTVRDLLDSHPRLSWHTKMSLAIQLMQGIAYLHRLNETRFSREAIVHQDIKPANLLVDSLSGSSGTRLKIADFGIAMQMNQVTLPFLGKIYAEIQQGNAGGTLFYVAPEVYTALCQRKASTELKSDVFSAGIVLWEIATGFKPQRTFKEIAKGRLAAFQDEKRDEKKRVSSSFLGIPISKQEASYPHSAFFGPVINKCIKPSPMRRYSAREALKTLQDTVIPPCTP